MSKTIRVLVVEDSESDADFAVRVLQRAGIDVQHERVETAAAMEAALRRRKWDAVISDYNMPQFSGMDALKILRATGLDIPFILVSGTVGEEIAVDALKAGAGDYVLKGNLSRLPYVLERELREAAMRAEHRLTQRELGESEDRFRDLVENSLDLICTHDLDGRLLMVNEAAVRLSGYPRDALLRMNMADLLVPQTRPLFAAYLAEVRTKGVASGLLQVLTAGGEIRWWEFRNSLRTGGVATAIVRGMAQDVTDRVRAEKAMRESELRFRQVAENIREVFWLTDPAKNQMLYISPAYEQIWGRSADALYASPREWLEAIHPDDRDRVIQAAQTKQGSGDYDEEYRITRPDGTIRWIRDRAFPVLSADRKVVRVAGIADDITERKLADLKIRRLNRVYAVLSAINALILRVRDRDELFREACRVAVEAGGFRLVWLGVVDRGAMRVRPVAWHGTGEDYIKLMPLQLADPVSKRSGLSGRAVMERKAMVSDDMTQDPRIVLKKEALERGFRSLAMLPLLVAGEAVGILALYAGEVGVFDEEEMKLLRELAGDIAFAVDHIDKGEKLDYLAYYDAVTGLANRTLFHERLERDLAAAGREGRTLALVMLDIERFKTINDTLGRQAGDALLKQIADRMTAYATDIARLARIGADHFAIMVLDIGNVDKLARRVEEQLENFFGQPFQIGGTELRIAGRLGIAVFPGDGADAEALFRNAEAALKKAKAGGDRLLFYTQEMNERVAEKLALETKLRQALKKDEFVLHYQPKVDTTTRRIVGVEALIRWQSPELGLVPPMKFIPLMEETGLILEAGSWALKQASRDHRRWVEQKLPAPRIAVNVSPIQLRQRDFVGVVEQAIMDGVAPTGIDLEITESLIMEDIERNIEKLKAVRGLGLDIAIDDFGTGYSSLGYLAKLPVQAVKIDRSFVVTMLNNADTMALVQTIISLAHSLRLKVIAEGVESEEQAKYLRLLRCDDLQGYLFSRPVPFDQMTALLAKEAKS